MSDVKNKATRRPGSLRKILFALISAYATIATGTATGAVRPGGEADRLDARINAVRLALNQRQTPSDRSSDAPARPLQWVNWPNWNNWNNWGNWPNWPNWGNWNNY
jgi:hypothetical protein